MIDGGAGRYVLKVRIWVSRRTSCAGMYMVSVILRSAVLWGHDDGLWMNWKSDLSASPAAWISLFMGVDAVLAVRSTWIRRS